MGISRARGIAWAKRFCGLAGRVFVMTGDGELQEGQNYEALQATVAQGSTELTVIVDRNKVQSDTLVEEIVGLGDLEAKLRANGWHVHRCDGHDHAALLELWRDLRKIRDRPKAVIAETIKGRGVSFMEHPRALTDGGGRYRWHAVRRSVRGGARRAARARERQVDRTRAAPGDTSAGTAPHERRAGHA
jgi:transketolase